MSVTVMIYVLGPVCWWMSGSIVTGVDLKTCVELNTSSDSVVLEHRESKINKEKMDMVNNNDVKVYQAYQFLPQLITSMMFIIVLFN